MPGALIAFLRGMREFRLAFTTSSVEHWRAYEWGRELAHLLTFRRYED
jgi:hypothetical protein